MKLTDSEFESLNGAASEAEWTEAIRLVKLSRGGEYPSDWYARILAPGIPTMVAARFGASARIHIVVNGKEIGP